jgi:hypothetical protein
MIAKRQAGKKRLRDSFQAMTSWAEKLAVLWQKLKAVTVSGTNQLKVTTVESE